MKKALILLIVCFPLIILGCEKKQKEETKKGKYEGKKILVVHSYTPYHGFLYCIINKNNTFTLLFYCSIRPILFIHDYQFYNLIS